MSLYRITGAITGLGAAPGVRSVGLGAGATVPPVGLGAAAAARRGSAFDPAVCDQGTAQVLRLLEVARARSSPQIQRVANALIDQWTALEARRQMGEGVCLLIAELGRRAEALVRHVAAGL